MISTLTLPHVSRAFIGCFVLARSPAVSPPAVLPTANSASRTFFFSSDPPGDSRATCAMAAAAARCIAMPAPLASYSLMPLAVSLRCRSGSWRASSGSGMTGSAAASRLNPPPFFFFFVVVAAALRA